MHLADWQVFDLILRLERVGFPCAEARQHLLLQIKFQPPAPPSRRLWFQGCFQEPGARARPVLGEHTQGNMEITQTHSLNSEVLEKLQCVLAKR